MPVFRNGLAVGLQETLHRADGFKLMLNIEHHAKTIDLRIGHEEEALQLSFLRGGDDFHQVRMFQLIGKITADKIDNIAA